jgi:hypothetical protein
LYTQTAMANKHKIDSFQECLSLEPACRNGMFELYFCSY